MGLYLNSGASLYAMATKAPVFVDKTKMILRLNNVVCTSQRYVCISRPRRFGKTMAADMICAYYNKSVDSRELFSTKLISKEEGWDRYLNSFDVFRIVMTDFFRSGRSVRESLADLSAQLVDDLEEEYPEVKLIREDLVLSMRKLYAKVHRQFIIVIDEWDAIFRENRDDVEGQRNYLNFLRDWLKDKEYVALAYMTGILPIKKYGEHSALNMFDEYSMASPLQFAQFTGFTEPEVKELCRKYGREFEEIKEWYDGYQLRDAIPPDPDYEMQKLTGQPLKAEIVSIYSPLSVIKAVQSGNVQNYWNATETYENLSHFISMNFDGLKEYITLLMNGDRRKVDITTYQNDMTTFHRKDDILAMLIHLGYLSYDEEAKEVFIPNREIMDVFASSTANERWEESFRSLRNSQNLLEAIWTRDAQRVAELLENAHLRAGTDGYHSEAGLSYALELSLYAADNYYTVIRELSAGKGYIDQAYIPKPWCADKPVLVVELKYNKSATTAITQIKRQEYPEALKAYKGKILLVGINYDREVDHDDPEFKHHTCIIEQA